MEQSNNKEECSQCEPRMCLNTLQQVLLHFKVEKKKLTAENDALREQTAIKELSWHQEKKILLDERHYWVSTLLMTRNNMYDAIRSAKANQNQFDIQHKELNRKCKEKKAEVRQLTESLHAQKMLTEKFKQSWKAEQDRLNKIKLSFDKTVTQLNEEVAAKLEALHLDRVKNVSQIIQEKEDVIAGVRNIMRTLAEENLQSLAKVRDLQTKINQRETARKEESFKKTQELQKESRAVEEMWLHKEQDWSNKEQDWLKKEEDWFKEYKDRSNKEQDWTNKEQNWLRKEQDWSNKEQDWLRKEQDWSNKEQDWTNKEQDWLRKEQDWSNKEQDWTNKEQDWLRKEQDWSNKEQDWTNKEQDWLKKGLGNIELQELTQKTDKVKAKMGNEEKKARKEMEKSLKKERKENEREERNRLKKEKKDNQEREKRKRREREEEAEQRRNLRHIFRAPRQHFFCPPHQHPFDQPPDRNV